jgi:hypothetical protein
MESDNDANGHLVLFFICSIIKINSIYSKIDENNELTSIKLVLDRLMNKNVL